MKTLAFALSSIVLAAAFATDVAAQTVYRGQQVVPFAQSGAGGRGGEGGGSGSARRVEAGPSACAARIAAQPGARNDLYRGSAPPPLDPARKILAVNCTQAFDPAGGGNLCCT